jgi:hypothetical protein
MFQRVDAAGPASAQENLSFRELAGIRENRQRLCPNTVLGALSLDSVEPPVSGNALQDVAPPVLEAQARGRVRACFACESGLDGPAKSRPESC